ncbi:DNA translocase FtsK 4TM domain-containing protein [Shewanella sp. CAL98-MNA-CIBAN-0140]|uniref:DNA translocase FtsK n=1 Tax=Shewanella sp. CAL98-MNA-CIBAN-0140 TaxID=3140462 RepID=UPI003317169E
MTQENSLKTLSGLQRLLEGGLILCCMVATYILLALSSFNPSDPGWSQSHFQGEIHNWTGAVGAWTADVLFYFFGFIAFLIPIMIATTGWFIFNRAHRLFEIDYFSVGLRIIGFILMLLALAALVSMNADDMFVFSAGGVAGDVIGQAMLPYFNKLGTTLLLMCFIGAGFTLATGISWLTIIELTGLGSIWCAKKLWTLPRLLKRERETEDTKGFMSLVDKFTQRRNEIDQQNDPSQDQPKKSIPAPIHVKPAAVSPPVVEKKRSFFSRKAKPTEDITVSDIDDEDLDIDVRQEPSMQVDNDDTHFAPWVATKDDIDFNIDDEVNNLNMEDEPSKEVANKPHSAAALVAQQKPKKEAKIVDGVVMIDGQGPQQTRQKMDPLPSITLLDVPDRKKNPISEAELQQVARLVEIKLADFNIIANVVGVYPGPVITRFELELAPGVKASKITNLSKDLARSLLSENVRVVEVIPGKAYVGLELPNKFRETVFMRDVLDSEVFKNSKSTLSMVLGQDIAGEPVVVDLGKMPHLLVAGTTGSGKSVGVNAMITSLLYKSGPDDVRFIMIDPKMLELSVYEGIPHLLCEVVTDMKEAANALRWCVGEMERRYKLMSALGVRNLKGYNIKIKDAAAKGEYIPDPLWKSSESMQDEAPPLEKLPSIVVVVDEFADMIMIVGKKVEELIARIAQKARAAGIHLILATQRPSVDVITGLIKANIPTRIAFQVSSRIDSRTILDQQGAETLLGMGDMLYLPPGTGLPNRVHGAFIDDHEVHKVVADWCARGKPQYIEEILNGATDGEQVLLPGETSDSEEELDALYDDAVAFVTETRRGSISSVQRKFKIGYNRAARIIEMMEGQGIVTAQGHNGNREVLAPPPPRT